jgi:hypothetical protein
MQLRCASGFRRLLLQGVICVYASIISLPEPLVAEELTAEGILSALAAQQRINETLSIQFEGFEVVPRGAFTDDPMVQAENFEGSEVSLDIEFPNEEHRSDVYVEWNVDFLKRKSRMLEKNDAFNISKNEFNKIFVESYLDLNANTITVFRPRSGNLSGVYKIPENTPEYYEYDEARGDPSHSNTVATALFASTGRLSATGGNWFTEPPIQMSQIDRIRKKSDGTYEFSLVPNAAGRTEISVSLDDGRALITRMILYSAGMRHTELSIRYDTNGMASNIEYAYFSLSDGSLETQGSLRQVDQSASRDPAKLVVDFPGVPIGGVITKAGRHYYVDDDYERIEFNSQVPRETVGSFGKLWLVLVLSAIVCGFALFVLRKQVGFSR